jgi:leucine dehydrogenase
MDGKVLGESYSGVIDSMLARDHEKIIYYSDRDSGLKAIVALHNTVLGPALGGTRIMNYASEEQALSDVLRLSAGMTYKSSVAGLDIGGGKAVIIGNPANVRTEAVLRKYGRFINTLGGEYITAEDVNVTVHDVVNMSKETRYVTGMPESFGGNGDPSVATAYGTYLGIKAAVKKVYGYDSLNNIKIGVEGVGKVGSLLVGHLANENAKIFVTDISPDNLKYVTDNYKATVVTLHDFYDLDLDVYAPCALGGTLNDNVISRLKCKIVAGCANNQLENIEIHSKLLYDKRIIYVPDFVINAGGVINAYAEFIGNKDVNRINYETEKIYDTCLTILHESERKNLYPNAVAMDIARRRIELVKNAGLSYRL